MDTSEEVLAHFGVRGMKWGVRNDAIAVSGVDRSNRSFGPPMIGVHGKGPALTKDDIKVLRKATSDALSGMQSKAAKREYGNLNTAIKNLVPQPKYDAAWQKAYDQQIAKILESHANKALKEPLISSVTATPTGEMILAVGAKPAIDIWKKDLSAVNHADNTVGVMTVVMKPIRDTQGFITGFTEGDSMMQSDSDEIDEVLKHVGILGMRWGVRRNNPSGSEKSRDTRVKVGDELKTIRVPKHVSTDAMKTHNSAVMIKKHGLKALTNQELKDLNYRINLEQNFRKMVPKEQGRIRKGKDIMEKMVWKAGEEQLQPYINKYANMGLAKALGSATIKAVV